MARLSFLRLATFGKVNFELYTSLGRVLAKLSLHEPLRAGINSKPTHLRDLLMLMDVTARAIPSTDVPTTPPRSKGAPLDVLASASVPRLSSEALDALTQPTALLVRVAFTLGNLTASNDRNRRVVSPKSTSEWKTHRCVPEGQARDSTRASSLLLLSAALSRTRRSRFLTFT